MWAMRPVLLALLTLGACGASDAVRSYAYVGHTSADRGEHFADEGQVHNECYVQVDVPKQPVAQRPAAADPELLAGATRVSVKLEDWGDHCDELAKTWQLVTYEPGHPGRAALVLPKKHNSVTDDLLLVGLELVMLVAIQDRYRKIRAARLGLS